MITLAEFELATKAVHAAQNALQALERAKTVVGVRFYYDGYQATEHSGDECTEVIAARDALVTMRERQYHDACRTLRQCGIDPASLHQSRVPE